MKSSTHFCVKLIHCGNRNIADPEDNLEKSLFFIPMGLIPMASQLKKNDFDVEVIHLDLESNNDIEKTMDFNIIDTVGLDCHWVSQGLGVLGTVALIKKINPGIFVFLGGYTASFFANEILSSYSGVDAVIRGDGERPIVELCEVLRKNRYNGGYYKDSLEAVPNLVWKRDSGEIIFNEFSYTATASELNQLDFADISLLRNWEYYRDHCKFWTKHESVNCYPLFLLEIGRGCQYNCSFCGGNSFAQKCISNRQGQVVRSVDSVVTSIKKAVSFGYSLFFSTFEFKGSDEWYATLFRSIKAENLQIRFGYGSWDLPSRFLIDELSECFDQAIIEISPETSDLELRKRNKDRRIFYDNVALEECLEYIQKKGNIRVQLYFGYFLPFETESTVYNTMHFISKLFLKFASFVEIVYTNLTADPCALLYRNPEKYGIDISVRNFADYIRELKVNLFEKKQSIFEINLFKPKQFLNTMFKTLRNKITLFKHLYAYFSHSIKLIQDRTGDSNTIVDALIEQDLQFTSENDIGLNFIKDMLSEICYLFKIKDIEILSSIRSEYKDASVSGFVSHEIKSFKHNETEIITEEERERISIGIREARECINTDFRI